MIQIWHNSKCSKSREAKKILEDNDIAFEVFNYLEENITKEILDDTIKKLDIEGINEMLRTGDELYKELDVANKSHDEICELVLKHHQLIQRPIVIKGDKAVIPRPMTLLGQLLIKENP